MNSFDSATHVYETLKQSAARWPAQIAVFDAAGEMTFGELFDQTEELKNKLLQCGIEQGESLAILCENSRHFIISLYAGIGSGCVVMPLAVYQREEEISKALHESGIHWVLCEDEKKFKNSGSIKFEIQDHSFFLSRTLNPLNEKVSQHFPGAAVMRFTSGTTADAKCAVLSHETILERTQAANEGLQLTEADRVIWVLPMAYHFVVSIMLYIRYGSGIIICEDFLAENILRKASKCGGTMLYASPMHIRLLAMSKENISMPKLKQAISTTSSIAPEVCKLFFDKYKISISQAFGIIEVGLPIMNREPTNENLRAVGKALPSFDVKILDDGLKELPKNEIGMLAIKGPGMFDGYLKPLRKGEEVLRGGWFLTGDLASMDAYGLIEIKGRSKNMINVSGNKVFPAEVEDVINLFDDVISSKVYGKPHLLLGEMVVADVVLKNEKGFDPESLINHCRKFLSPFKVPQRIYVVKEIEMTGSGKVKRG
jgi:long-chain acyl-CoA synthetase